MAVPAKIWLYRMTHIDNLRHILQEGLLAASHPNADPSYRPIGDKSLIEVRKELDAPNPPGGKFSDYVPFYLGHRSPMLYQIATGYEGVTKALQTDIIYIVVDHDCVVSNGLEWFFTDGHARHGMTKFHTAAVGFEELDWEAIYATQWRNTEDDPDRQRKKQAEYMVKTKVPVSCFAFILVFDEKSKQKVEYLRQEIATLPPVKISDKAYYDHL